MKSSIFAALLATTATILTLGAIAPSASAYSFVPQEEGEIDVDFGCLDPLQCIELDPIFKSIESLQDASSGGFSRLFVDSFDTVNTYGDNIRFGTKDAGTNHEGFWFRPSEVSEERGQLEVGTYRFTFAEVISELTIDYFDTESFPTTGVLELNGEPVGNVDYVARGRDGNIVSQTFTDVKSLVLKLGNDSPSGTGDGVNFRLAGRFDASEEPVDVPEPASLLGLLAVGALGTIKIRRKS
ncbi:MAG: LEVG family PEP-CTERM protein [Cyanobacteria bacterium P01_E01_bin.42]